MDDGAIRFIHERLLTLASQSDLKRWQHLCNILQPARLTSIVDIGANPVEPAPYDALVRAGLAEVLAFEPQVSAYKALLANPQANQTVLPYAVGDGKNGTLNICRVGGFTSLLEPNPDAFDYLGRWKEETTVIDTLEVSTKRLDDIKEVKHADLIKIDIQGGELAVFKNGRKTLGRACVVITEVAAIPLYKNQPLLHEQMKLLHDRGFHLHKFLFFKPASLISQFAAYIFQRDHINQLVDGDAAFIKSLLSLDKMKDEDLKHLAIVSDAVLQSHDLVLKILGILLKRKVWADDAGILEYCKLLPNPRMRRLKQAIQAVR